MRRKTVLKTSTCHRGQSRSSKMWENPSIRDWAKRLREGVGGPSPAACVVWVDRRGKLRKTQPPLSQENRRPVLMCYKLLVLKIKMVLLLHSQRRPRLVKEPHGQPIDVESRCLCRVQVRSPGVGLFISQSQILHLMTNIWMSLYPVTAIESFCRIWLTGVDNVHCISKIYRYLVMKKISCHVYISENAWKNKAVIIEKVN